MESKLKQVAEPRANADAAGVDAVAALAGRLQLLEGKVEEDAGAIESQAAALEADRRRAAAQAERQLAASRAVHRLHKLAQSPNVAAAFGSGGGGASRARSHCRFAPPLIHFIPYSRR